jgi:hypothetical protein
MENANCLVYVPFDPKAAGGSEVYVLSRHEVRVSSFGFFKAGKRFVSLSRP